MSESGNAINITPRKSRVRPFDPDLAASYPVAVGCDEVGRGALCGPVVVAAVWFDPTEIAPPLLAGLDDSKKLTARQRVQLDGLIRRSARIAIAVRSAAQVDRLGIREATFSAMTRAIRQLNSPSPAYIDGNDVPAGLHGLATSVVRGESKVPQIAAASIVAKVFRDNLMERLAQRYNVYGWAKNVGYGTAEHLAALAVHGPCRHHRYSFSPVAEAARTRVSC